MKKYKIRLISLLIICIFAVQPVAAYDDDGFWDDFDEWYDDWDDDYDDWYDDYDDWWNDDDDDWWRTELDEEKPDNFDDEEKVDVGYGDKDKDDKDKDKEKEDKEKEKEKEATKALETALNKLLDIVEKSELPKGIKDAIKDGRVTVKDDKSEHVFQMGVKYIDGEWVYSITYNSEKVSATDDAAKLVIAHEIYHFDKFEKGETHGAKTNEKHHDSMVNDPDYKDMLKELIPGKDDEYYDKAVYAGTPGTPVYDDLSDAEKKAIEDFFKDNDIY